MIRIFVLTTLVLALSFTAHAQGSIRAPFILTGSDAPAVTFGIEDTVSVASTGASATISFTVTNADLLLVGTSLTFSGMTGVTWNGSAMTLVEGGEYSGFGAFVYKLANPATGTHNIVVTPQYLSDMVISVTSVKKTHNTTPISGAATAEGTSTTPSVNVSSASGALVIDWLCWNIDTAPSVTVGAGQTQKAQRTRGDYCGGGSSTEPGAGSVTMSWTIGTAREWKVVALSVNSE